MWQDIRSREENERIWRFVQTEIPINWRDRTGIITFSDTTKQQLQSSCPEELKNLIYIATISEWVGEERDLVLVRVEGKPQQLDLIETRTLLTRGCLSLVFFGDLSQWEMSTSLLSQLFDVIQVDRELT